MSAIHLDNLVKEFGSFTPRIYKGRQVQNPRTREMMTVPDRQQVKFQQAWPVKAINTEPTTP